MWEIDETKDAAKGECLAKGCSKTRNPGGCCFCWLHHPRCGITKNDVDNLLENLSADDPADWWKKDAE